VRPRGRRAAVAGTVAVLTAASLSLVAWSSLTGSTATAAGTTARMDGARVEVHSAEWTFMDHVEDGEGGFLMPDEMMPGAPTGDEVRLGVRVTLTNTASRLYEFSLVDEFTLARGRDSEPFPLRADTVGQLGRLAPDTALNATLYFDIQVSATDDLPPLFLRWTRDNETVLIQVPTPGEAPEHHH
jgi:hypothetical protein